MNCSHDNGRWMARLLAGLFYLQFASAPVSWQSVRVAVSNELDVTRQGQIVELSWREIIKRNPALKAEAVYVRDAAGKTLLSQAVDEDGDGIIDTLLVQADFAAGETRQLQIVSGQPGTPQGGSLVHAMFYPKRADDFSWENDRIAFRMYGPALMKTDPPSSGVDVWCKHVPELVAMGSYSAK